MIFVSSNYLTAEGCRLLGEASGAEGCRLRTLVLRENPIGPDGAALIAKVSPPGRAMIRENLPVAGHLARSGRSPAL